MGLSHCAIFLADADHQVMTAIASRGYGRPGAGAEIAWGRGIVGLAAEQGQNLRLSCVGRNFLYINAVREAGQSRPDPARQIPMPGLDSSQSLLAIPMIAGGEVRGLIFAESLQRLAFAPADERAVALVAAQLGALVALHETSRELDAALSQTARTGGAASSSGQPVQVRHFAYDDSLFIGQDYVIKGVPGRLLWRMLRAYVGEGRIEFTNREFRLDPAMKLPDYKDNLETRLLLLARRLAENDWPVRISRSGRGRVLLEVAGPLVLLEQ
jgi:adenylate cyclase